MWEILLFLESFEALDQALLLGLVFVIFGEVIVGLLVLVLVGFLRPELGVLTSSNQFLDQSCGIYTP